MSYCNLVGLKDKLKDLREEVKWLETPFVWEIPPHIKDNMSVRDLQRVITNKINEISDFDMEKVAALFLEWVVQYFLKTLLERPDLEEEFKKCGHKIDDMKVKGLSAERASAVRTELKYLLFCTKFAVYWLRGEPIERILEEPQSTTTITGIKAWYNMVLYNYDPARILFQSITHSPEYTPLYAFYHGKTLARQRRRRNDRMVTDDEVKLLLTGRDRHLALPIILTTFDNAGPTSVIAFRYKKDFKEILKKAWEGRDAYHSQNTCRLASIFMKRNEEDKARELFDMAIRLNPKCSMTLHKYGSFLIREGDLEKGARFMIQANHMPAFLHLIKLIKFPCDEFLDFPALFDKVELVMVEIPIALPIRYTIFKYYLEHRMMAKALHHLQVMYKETKHEPVFEFSESERTRSNVANLISPGKKLVIPEKIDILEECKKMRKLHKRFDDWMVEMEKERSGYQVFDLTQL